MTLYEMWQRGASYEELHDASAPHNNCGCDVCDAAREKEKLEDGR